LLDYLRRQSSNLGFILGVILLTGGAMFWRAAQFYPLHDFYPLYYGGLAWRQTGSAYLLERVVPPPTYEHQLLSIGNAYPLPAVLLTLPLSFLPAKTAAVLWVGLLVTGLLLSLRLNRLPYFFCLYLPVLDGIRIEQYTILVVELQLAALWAYHQRRPWWLAFFCALILTKPSQGLLFVVVMIVLARNWKQQLVTLALIWGGSVLLAPRWPGEWLSALHTYIDIAQWPIPWGMILFALPLVLAHDWITAAIVAQIALFPFQGTYNSAAMPIAVLKDRWFKWLAVLSCLWPVPAFYLGKEWGTALTHVLPAVLLILLRRKGAQRLETG
jgi:hypothetical protein